MIRGLIFDWGGVLQRTVDRAPRRELAAELGLSEGELERAVFDSDAWHRACVGRLSGDAVWTATAAAVGWPTQRLDEFVARFFGGDRLNEPLLDAIRHLRRRGVGVVLCSNAPPARSGQASAGRWGMEGLFDAQVFSHDVGELKPHPAMYREALRALGADAAGALFVDDVPANVDAARALGIDGLLFTGNDELLRELASRGLPLPSERSHEQ